MLISEFYENQEILITGGTGFIGKAVIEKLLRSCSKLKCIYILIRGKKNTNIKDRLQKLTDDFCFQKLRKENNEAFKKLIPIEGDCSQIGLGIKPEDLKRLQNVSIVFHSAASVRFEEPVKDAILLNTRGTYELVKLAQNFKNLKSFVHVSTTYCTGSPRVIEEKVYKPPVDWKKAIEIAETYDHEFLDILNMQYGCHQFNSYTFTKSLAEDLIVDFKDKLPITIFRPSIVVGAVSEPIPGWVDNLNGPTGIMIACGTGLCRTYYTSGENLFSVVPIDIVTRSLLVAGYKLGLETMKNQKSKELQVYNCAVDKITPITLKRLIDVAKVMIKKNPFEKMLWAPGGHVTKCLPLYLYRFACVQLPLSLMFDGVLKILGKKTLLMKMQRKIQYTFSCLDPFIQNEWDFKADKFFALEDCVPDSERETFGFLDMAHYDPFTLYENTIRSAKLLFMKEAPDSSPSSRFRLKANYFIEDAISRACIIYGCWYLYKSYIGCA